ncbi:hypothetical protein EX30DRAFT_344046 [Ascodesmis nigricans]|uniref:Uncharacterized protein n=1 Tax=Ascodesmis nigricans TaxID=341454 RepID=A0A4S2MKT8_9PEZI|nr:hypothetical protein EX30DRAFT_344046 [Ascodesmis nigricans]
MTLHLRPLILSIKHRKLAPSPHPPVRNISTLTSRAGHDLQLHDSGSHTGFRYFSHSHRYPKKAHSNGDATSKPPKPVSSPFVTLDSVDGSSITSSGNNVKKSSESEDMLHIHDIPSGFPFNPRPMIYCPDCDRYRELKQDWEYYEDRDIMDYCEECEW